MSAFIVSLCLHTPSLGMCMLCRIMHLMSNADLFSTQTNTNSTLNSYSAVAAIREQVSYAFLLQLYLVACAKQ